MSDVRGLLGLLTTLAVAVSLGCAGEAGEPSPGSEPEGEGMPADSLQEAPPIAPAAALGPARVAILDPADGARIEGYDVPVRLSASGVRIAPASVHEPGTAHHHLFLDLDPTPAGEKIPAGRTGIIHLGQGDSTFTFLDVEPGRHRIIAVLGDSAHVPLAPPATDTVEFTVRGSSRSP